VRRGTRKITASSERSTTAQLRELLRAKSAELNHNALSTDGAISPEELASLERISKAVHLSDELASPPSRWWRVAALVFALVLVSLLFLVRVPETEVTMDVEASEVSFILATEKPVIGRAGMTQLGVSGLDVVRVSPDAFPELSVPHDDAVAAMMRLTVLADGVPKGAINTATLIPPPETRVWLRHMDFLRSYRLSLKPARKGTRIALQADVRGSVAIAAPGRLEKARRLDFGKSGATLQFESTGDMLDVDFVLANTADVQFYAQIPVTTLELLRIEEFALPQKSLVAPLSTVLSGVIYFDSLNGERYQLRTGEHIRFSASKGRIESLRLLDDRIAFKFRGRVGGMRVGQEEVSRNLMPNLLQWLKARQPVSLVWGATIFVYGLIVSALGWYRKSS
jgi:hypothetical protein